MIELVPYDNKYKSDFKQLNIVWLDKYGLTESHDLEVLDDPEGTVIARGGLIFLAKDGVRWCNSVGFISRVRSLPFVAFPPATSRIKANGLHS